MRVLLPPASPPLSRIPQLTDMMQPPKRGAFLIPLQETSRANFAEDLF
jgi:hypothetical protein